MYIDPEEMRETFRNVIASIGDLAGMTINDKEGFTAKLYWLKEPVVHDGKVVRHYISLDKVIYSRPGKKDHTLEIPTKSSRANAVVYSVLARPKEACVQEYTFEPR